MADVLDPHCRSENMRRIRSKNTSPELKLRKALHALGYRYRLHVAGLPGKPDLVFPKLSAVIEVRGCFWHQHPNCKEAHIPKTRREYWGPKLSRNQQRDRENLKVLKSLGWRVLVVWECQLKRFEKLMAKVQAFLAITPRDS